MQDSTGIRPFGPCVQLQTALLFQHRVRAMSACEGKGGGEAKARGAKQNMSDLGPPTIQKDVFALTVYQNRPSCSMVVFFG